MAIATNDGPYDIRTPNDPRPPHTTKGLRNAFRRTGLSMSFKEWARSMSHIAGKDNPLQELACVWLRRKGLTSGRT